LYESSQLQNMFESVRQWCDRMGFEYFGGLGVSAGELQGVLMQYLPFRIGPTAAIAQGAEKLAVAIDNREKTGDIFAEPRMFPRKLFMLVANRSWDVNARKNGISPKDLYRQL
ncbi:MAG: flavodoxin, partial [Oscillospiraceae bacterium]|nr:flavodoxin [Oscillospiraceae bacterium]